MCNPRSMSCGGVVAALLPIALLLVSPSQGDVASGMEYLARSHLVSNSTNATDPLADLKLALEQKGLHLDDLDQDDIGKLESDHTISAAQAILAKHYLAKKHEDDKKKESLPFPDLPEGEFPSPSELSAFGGEPLPLKPVGGFDAGAPDLSKLDAKDWTKVLFQCLLTRGRLLNDLSSAPYGQLLLPPNSNKLVTAFEVSQLGSDWQRNACFNSEFSHNTALTQTDVTVKVSCPFAYAAYSYSHDTEHQDVTMGSHYSVSTTYIAPVGTFFFPPHDVVKVDDDDEGFVRVNPEFVRSFRQFLDSNITRCDIGESARHIFDKFGDVYVSKATIGVAAYSTEDRIVQSEQQLDKAKTIHKAVVGGGFLGFSAEAGMTHGEETAHEAGTEYSWSAEHFTAIGGNTGDGEKPASIAKYRTDPNSWRSIQYLEVKSTTELLPKDLRDRVPSKIETEWVFPSSGCGPGGHGLPPCREQCQLKITVQGSTQTLSCPYSTCPAFFVDEPLLV